MKRKAQIAAILAGGLVGPFAGQSLAIILPEFAETFDVTLSQAALTMSLYLFPFATMMIFSSRMVRGFSPSRVVVIAYGVTVLAALLLIFTPIWELFVVGFVVMGVANAFTMPLLILILKEITPEERLGGVLGTYTAMQSLGILMSPLFSGVAALVNWRLTYLLVVVISLAIILVGLPHVPAPGKPVRDANAPATPWRPMIIQMVTCTAIGFGVIGMGFAVSLHAGERFDLDSAGRGFVVMCGGLAAFLLSRSIGSAADRTAPQPVLLISLVVAIVAMVLLPTAPYVWALAVVWGVGVAAAQGVQTTVNLLVLSTPGGGSFLSTVQAFRFYGVAFAPVVMLVVYQSIGAQVFWVSAAIVAVGLVLQLAMPRQKTR